MSKKPIEKQFEEFKSRNNLTDYAIIEIATTYAYTSKECSRTALSRSYGISEHIFYRLLDFAVIASLVDEETQNKILMKRISNNTIHGGSDAAKISILHKNEILNLQKEYNAFLEMHLNSFSEEAILKICKDFRDGKSIPQLATEHKTSNAVINLLLEKGLLLLFDTYLRVKKKMGK